MKSKWYEYKEVAVSLRTKGKSIRYIEKNLGIPRSTLSGWLKSIRLTDKQKDRLKKIQEYSLIKARSNAVIWHNKQKGDRLLQARAQALSTLSKIDTNDRNSLELALAFLYLGEGSKTNSTSMGNSDPRILKFFIQCLSILYDVKKSDIRCSIHIRRDQNGKQLNRYWAKELKIPLRNFGTPLVDKRTIKSATYPYYKGVCVVRAGKIAIQRNLVFLSKEFCDKIISTDD